VLAPDEEREFDLSFKPNRDALERTALNTVSTDVSSGVRSRQAITIVGKGGTGGLPV
jgi:hypothetical protein